MQKAKIAMQVAAVAGLIVAADTMAAAPKLEVTYKSAAANDALAAIDLGEYLQGDYALKESYYGRYLPADYIQVAELTLAQADVGPAQAPQTAALPLGTIRLRVIPRIGGETLDEAISWQITTFGRDSSGARPTIAEVTGATPELTLPAGWYVVHARMADQTIKHPVEVTAGHTFKYTLVKN